MPPYGFSWIDEPRVAGLAYPHALEDLQWLRANGVQVLLSLTESPPPRQAINEAGLLSIHVPIPDMNPPSEQQLNQIIAAIRKANATEMGVAVHCAAGRGRTGTVLAAHLVSKGLSALEAIRRVRELRPGSIETPEQERAVVRFAQRPASA
ncbi:MAG: dual specificity protein phosphatase 23 [Gemmataceae bacterium]